MELTNFIRIAFLVICIGTALTFFALAIIKRNKLSRNLNIAGILFLLAILFNFSIIKLENTIFPPTDKIGQLRFLAFGKATNNENGWLGLYKDSSWEFGKSYREISTNGSYYVSGDTIFLKLNYHENKISLFEILSL